MEELELSIMIHTAATESTLQRMLKDFEQETGIQVHLNCLDWMTARAELNKTAFYHRGPDVSEVGSTWVSDLAHMNVLASLTSRELDLIGRPSDFAPAAWSMCQFPDEPDVWAVPWHAETYVIHYRRDLLQKAGVDETTAFRTHADLSAAVQKLAEADMPVPVELPMDADRFCMLHSLASWVWANGGEFFSPDFHQSLLDQPRELEAICSFFGLLRSASPKGRQWMIDKGGSPLFHAGRSAITFGTMRLAMPETPVAPELTENWAWAPLPTPCFVGGSNLVIWQHTRHREAALRLVEFLTSSSTMEVVNRPMATLPPRLSALNTPQFTADPMLKVMGQAIQSGRAYQPLRLWGLVEDKMVASLLKVGTEVLNRPQDDLEEIVRVEIGSLVRRLGNILN